MGLVARKDFIGENGRQYKAGEACDDALNWRYPALRACLNLGIIEDQTGEVNRKFNIRTRELTEADRDSMIAKRVEKGMRQRAKERAMKAARKIAAEAGEAFDLAEFEANYVEAAQAEDPSLEAVQAQADMVRENSGIAAPVAVTSIPEKLVGVDVPVETAPVSAPTSSEPAAPTSSETPAGELPAADLKLDAQVACPECDKVFGSEHALRIHAGKAHRG